MPIDKDNFKRFTDTTAADIAAANAIGAAAKQAQENEYPRKKIKIITGNLMGSHTFKVAQDGSYVDVGNSAEYAPEVHDGTGRRPARPWLKDGVQNNLQSITDFGLRAWERAMEK